MTRIIRISLILLIAGGWGLLPACGERAVQPSAYTPPRVLTGSENELVHSANGFGFDLFRAVSQEYPEENIFISPLSVSMALGMTYNGADGSTREAMESVLGLQGLSLEEINRSYQSLIELLGGLDETVEFSLANSIWYRRGFPVSAEFIDLNRTYFNALVRGIDFSDPQAVPTINGWVSDNTRGKIDKIISPPIKPSTMMYLINAIYFKGDWSRKFDPEDTRLAYFLKADNTTVEVPMMRQAQKDFFKYYGNDLFQAVDLPYGEGLYSMTLLLPQPGITTAELISWLEERNWDDMIGQMKIRDISLYMPRFKLRWGSSLNQALIALGMEVAFQPCEADFSKIADLSPNNLFISNVLHKTFIDVNEDGTEAAAVTLVEMEITSIDPVKQIRIDRPFLFAIREDHSQTILFLGRIADPLGE
ncbi:MAG: serpin family protein [Candidatus Krumholzibacteriota bacterium]|nr:serpin family protein [Candidatus Krumholzibacteriota bacterium]